jgi:soluble lytic murein transglycosylase-like protein
MKAADRYDSLIKYYSELHGFIGMDWLRFKAQIRQESNFDPNAVSSVGARGLAQFMPLTWQEWHDGTPGLQQIVDQLALIDPRDPEDAIKAQINYMKWLLRRLTTWDRAFAGYNWGIGNVLKLDKKLDLDSTLDWSKELPKETRDYIFNIDKFYKEYERGW